VAVVVGERVRVVLTDLDRRDELAVGVARHAIGRIALLGELDDEVAADRRRTIRIADAVGVGAVDEAVEVVVGAVGAVAGLRDVLTLGVAREPVRRIALLAGADDAVAAERAARRVEDARSAARERAAREAERLTRLPREIGAVALLRRARIDDA